MAMRRIELLLLEAVVLVVVVVPLLLLLLLLLVEAPTGSPNLPPLRTAKIRPSLRRMYTPFSVLMTQIQLPAGMRLGAAVVPVAAMPPLLVVIVFLPGITMSVVVCMRSIS